MNRYSTTIHYHWLFFFSRSLSNTNRAIVKNFDKKTFDHLYARRLQLFNNDKEQMSKELRTQVESILKSSSIINDLKKFNSIEHERFSRTITIEQLRDILFFAYEHNLKLNLFTSRLIECVTLAGTNVDLSLFLELVNLFVLHQQKHYDSQTKKPNKIFENLIHRLESNLMEDQVKNISIVDISLICSAMYRLQIPFQNKHLLSYISQCLIDDETRKHLSAVDKQNLIKLLTLSNHQQLNVAQSLANRFNQSFEQNLKSNLDSFSYEIVRMTMRIGVYFSMCRYYSSQFFTNCLQLIELESNASAPSYRAKDIIQLMNTLIYIGHVRKSSSKYLNLIDIYQKMGQFHHQSERLVDVLATLAMIDCFPEQLLQELFTKENLQQFTESRMKEKLFFISESYKVLRSSHRSLLDQKFIQSLPYHLFGSWQIEKQKRPQFSLMMQHLLERLPNRFYVKSAFLLKHFKIPDIIIRLNAKQQPQIIPNVLTKSIDFSDDANQSTMYALQVLSVDELCVNEPLRLIGSVYSKIYQLQKLNYTPVIIYPNDCLERFKTSQDICEWIVQRARKTELLLNQNLL